MNIQKELGLDTFVSRAVGLGQDFLDRSSQVSNQVSSQVSKFVGTEGARVADDARNAVAAGLTTAATYFSARRSFLRSPLFITLSVGAAAAAVAYYNREKLKAAALRAKEAVEPQVRQAAKTIQDKVSHLTDSAANAVETAETAAAVKKKKTENNTRTAATH